MNVMKTKEAMEYLNIGRVSLMILADTGKIKFFETPGGQKRFLKSELDKFVNGDNIEKGE